MHDAGAGDTPSVVVVGAARSRAALGSLFASWGWPVLALEADDLAGVAAMRRSGADLMVVDGSGYGTFGDLDRARAGLASQAVVRLVDRPQDLTTDRSSVLGGLPAARLRRALLDAVRNADARVA